jgi:A/B hydrolase-like, N-terminal domain
VKVLLALGLIGALGCAGEPRALRQGDRRREARELRERPDQARKRAFEAYSSGKFAECAELYSNLARAGGGSADAYNGACCLARSGKIDEAFRTLEQAIDLGFFNDIEHLRSDSDFESLRSDPRWSRVLERAQARRAEYRASLNAELLDLFEEDQADRKGGVAGDWKAISARDAARRKRVAGILDAGGARAASDYFHAAMVFQHGDAAEDYRRARDLALRAADLDPSRREYRWLAAAATDRALVHEGKPQKFGTQSRCKLDGQCKLDPVDPNVTDEERARWGVPPLAVARRHAEEMSKQMAREFRRRTVESEHEAASPENSP